MLTPQSSFILNLLYIFVYIFSQAIKNILSFLQQPTFVFRCFQRSKKIPLQKHFGSRVNIIV